MRDKSPKPIFIAAARLDAATKVQLKTRQKSNSKRDKSPTQNATKVLWKLSIPQILDERARNRRTKAGENGIWTFVAALT
tara:strand:- start:4861 stop:5100 length:240 start_codon:yes stop_codon:yes gene_type:complete